MVVCDKIYNCSYCYWQFIAIIDNLNFESIFIDNEWNYYAIIEGWENWDNFDPDGPHCHPKLIIL